MDKISPEISEYIDKKIEEFMVEIKQALVHRESAMNVAFLKEYGRIEQKYNYILSDFLKQIREQKQIEIYRLETYEKQLKC